MSLPPITQALLPQDVSELTQQGWELMNIGTSEAGQTLWGLIWPNKGPLLTVVAGAHPDEPAGPRASLNWANAWPHHALAQHMRVALVPYLDIDGIRDQAAWLHPWSGRASLSRYLQHRLRRLPGADREFAWPGSPWRGPSLVENDAADAFFEAHGPAIAHASMHGMSHAHGAWYLLDAAAMNCPGLWQAFTRLATEIGLHEYIRHGDKGFRRAGLGFCTTPYANAMRQFFLQQHDWQTARAFGYSSMDAARARARRHHSIIPICMVSEYPLFQYPASITLNNALSELMAYSHSDDFAHRCAVFQQDYQLHALDWDIQIRHMSHMLDCFAEAAYARWLRLSSS